jgi:hypothetical protein
MIAAANESSINITIVVCLYKYMQAFISNQGPPASNFHCNMCVTSTGGVPSLGSLWHPIRLQHICRSKTL